MKTGLSTILFRNIFYEKCRFLIQISCETKQYEYLFLQEHKQKKTKQVQTMQTNKQTAASRSCNFRHTEIQLKNINKPTLSVSLHVLKRKRKQEKETRKDTIMTRSGLMMGIPLCIIVGLSKIALGGCHEVEYSLQEAQANTSEYRCACFCCVCVCLGGYFYLFFPFYVWSLYRLIRKIRIMLLLLCCCQ